MAKRPTIVRQTELMEPADPSPAQAQPAAMVAPAPPVAIPKTIEFRPVGSDQDWRVESFDLLATEFGLVEGSQFTPDQLRDRMAQFAFFACQHQRLWLLVRRFYGVSPMIPTPDVSLDDLRVWTIVELEAAGFSVKPDLEVLGKLWSDHIRREVGSQPVETAGQLIHQAQKDELPLDDKVLEQFQFSERLFKITVFDPMANDNKGGDVPRSDRENKLEREWFIGRVKEWSRMLADAIAGPVARTALLNDLYLRRLEAEIATASTRARAALYEQKAALANEYNTAIEKLQEMFPEMAVAGKVTFRGVISDLIVAHRDYYADADRRMVDKVSSALEIPFVLRSSNQVRERYRFSLNLAIAEAINGLYDPNFRPTLKDSVKKKIDAAVNAALDAAREAQKDHIVDLENGVLPGEGDGFEDFNDAECQYCGSRISSQARKCPECRKEVKKREA